MRTHVSRPCFICCALAAIRLAVLSTAPVLIFSVAGPALQPARGEVIDPLAVGPCEPESSGSEHASAPVDAAAYFPQQHPRHELRCADYQTSNQTPFADDPAKGSIVASDSSGPMSAMKDPCAAVPAKPLNELGISIAQPAGKLPIDLASPCWEQINQQGGGCAAARRWPAFCYQWDATCFCHQPLYFEEINLERYGYGCDCCLQPAASAAHFFGTIPALPYCMAVECPGDCIYTLGHYRPGSCPPWRWHWPPCDPLAAAAEGGVWTGLIFAIP